MNQDYLTIIRDRLQQAFSPDYLEVIDESNQHHGHAGDRGGNSHFAIVISAACFKKLSRLEAHQQIYALFNDILPNQIHALRIKIYP
jgi:BolA protein